MASLYARHNMQDKRLKLQFGYSKLLDNNYCSLS